MDSIPGLSQFKSFIQLITGNSKGALQTQINFVKRCPVVSQITSVVQVIGGNGKGAIETQITFLKGLNSMVDSVPVVGHAKGVVHYICRDTEGGDNAMRAASHTLGVVAGGVGGFVVGGPPGAAVGGAMLGTYVDCIISSVDLANNKTDKLYGVCDNLLHIIEDPTDAGNYVDLVGGIVLDGVAGHAAGTAIGEHIKYRSEKKNLAKAVGNEATKDIIDTGESMREFRSKNKIKKNKPHVMTKAKDRVTGKTAMGHNKSVRQIPLPDVPTELQKRVPNAKQVQDRPSSNCAEHQAYNGVYQARPKASPGDLTSVSVKWHHKSQRIVTVPGCANCKEFGSAMGTVYSDAIPETHVPLGMEVFAGVCIAGGVSLYTLEKSFEKQHKTVKSGSVNSQRFRDCENNTAHSRKDEPRGDGSMH